MFLLSNLFFYAFIGMFGLLVSIAFINGIKLGQDTILGVVTIKGN